MFGLLYLFLLACAVPYVMARGDGESRTIIGALLFCGAVTATLVASGAASFEHPSAALVANEGLLLAVTVGVAIRSEKYWPLLVAALELIAFLSLLVPFTDANAVSYAIGAMQGLWAYPQMLILLLVTFRTTKATRPRS